MGKAREAIALLQPYRESLDTETLNALGIALSDAGRGKEALAIFARIQEIDPGNGLAYQNGGIALLKLDRAAEARENLEKAIAIHDRNPRAWNALGVADATRIAEEAIEAWTKAVAYNPKQYDALYNIGLVSARTGRPGARGASSGSSRRRLPRNTAETLPSSRSSPR
jgi:tetratricopeptide (TPR) repeat protein